MENVVRITTIWKDQESNRSFKSFYRKTEGKSSQNIYQSRQLGLSDRPGMEMGLGKNTILMITKFLLDKIPLNFAEYGCTDHRRAQQPTGKWGDELFLDWPWCFLFKSAKSLLLTQFQILKSSFDIGTSKQLKYKLYSRRTTCFHTF